MFSQCAVNRPSGASPVGRMALLNHWLQTNDSGILIPNRAAANVTNSAATIMAHADVCSGLYQRYPNFILVRCSVTSDLPGQTAYPVFQLDWISIGDAMLVQATLNGVPFTPGTSTTGQTGSPTVGPSGNGIATGTVAQTQVSMVLVLR